ncbi:MAG: DUF1376 domain-containing protein, partial [Sedimenticola sp.]
MAKNSANTLDQGKAPAFQFYAADFDTATRGWLPEEVGIYIRLLCNQWTTGPLPTEPRRLAAIVGMSPQDFEQVWKSTVGSKFVESKDGFYNERLEKVREEQRAFRKRQSEKGRKGAAARWHADGTGNAPDNGPGNSTGNGRGNSTGYGREHGRNMAL